jgi:hypothetical protein
VIDRYGHVNEQMKKDEAKKRSRFLINEET